MNMLLDNMTLNQMIHFEPNDEDMVMLPLNATVYIKATVVSLVKEDNYNFIRYLFSDTETNDYINDLDKISFYDFDASNTNQDKFITIFEMTSKPRFEEVSLYLEEKLKEYNHDALIVIDLYTHDSKKYRLSDFDGVIKLEKLYNEQKKS